LIALLSLLYPGSAAADKMVRLSLGWQQAKSWSKTKFFNISKEITEDVIVAALHNVPVSHLIQVRECA
jgi:hypothetical protein